jgi:hypothetical protein
MASLWLVDPATLPAPSDRKRRIGRKPLINLAKLQMAINGGALGDDDVLLATHKCNTDVQNLQWSVRDLLDCLGCLQPGDHRGAEWCKNGGDQWVACDAYAIRYDDANRCRSKHGLEFYLKFSIDEDGALTLIMISVHLSQ